MGVDGRCCCKNYVLSPINYSLVVVPKRRHRRSEPRTLAFYDLTVGRIVAILGLGYNVAKSVVKFVAATHGIPTMSVEITIFSKVLVQI